MEEVEQEDMKTVTSSTHPELRGDLAAEALFQMLVDVGDRETVAQVADAGQCLVHGGEVPASAAEERAVLDRDH